jgi:hypothetical protein
MKTRAGHLLLLLAQRIALAGFRLIGGHAEDWPSLPNMANNYITFRRIYEEVKVRKTLAEQARLSELFERAWHRTSSTPVKREQAN